MFIHNNSYFILFRVFYIYIEDYYDYHLLFLHREKAKHIATNMITKVVFNKWFIAHVHRKKKIYFHALSKNPAAVQGNNGQLDAQNQFSRKFWLSIVKYSWSKLTTTVYESRLLDISNILKIRCLKIFMQLAAQYFLRTLLDFFRIFLDDFMSFVSQNNTISK